MSLKLSDMLEIMARKAQVYWIYYGSNYINEGRKLSFDKVIMLSFAAI